MPIGVLAFVLYPIGASFPCFYIIDKSIWVIKYVAQNIMYLPKAIIYTGYVNDFAIMLFIFSFLWISIWKSSIRFYGFVGLIICIFSFLGQTKPDFIINLNSNFIAEYNGREVVIYSDRLTSFTRNFVANWYGHDDAKFIKTSMDGRICLRGAEGYSQKSNSPGGGCNYSIDIPYRKISYNGIAYDFTPFSSIYLDGKKLKITNNENGRFGVK